MKPLAWSLLPEEWRSLCQDAAQPAYRAGQVWNWLYVRRADAWDAMSNVPVALREVLSSKLDLHPWVASTAQEAPDGVTKLLLTCRDGEQIETVLIPAEDRRTVCVSTQAGCAFGCAFCASGRDGCVRDLEAGEMVGQVLAAAAVAQPRRVTHLVFMGMGEPLANYERTLRAVRILNDFDGLAIGARRMTLSTCGLVPGIRRLAEEGLQIELSVSLHAPDDALRARLMPVNTRYPLAELLAACGDYTARTGRIITFEYTLVSGLNDRPSHARVLVELLRPLKCRVNLIPLSPVAEFDGTPPSDAECQAFADFLNRARINTTLRHSRGGSVAAACGQLRLHHARTARSGNQPPHGRAPGGEGPLGGQRFE